MATTAQDVAVKIEQPSDAFIATEPQEPKEVTLDSVRKLLNTDDLAKLERGVAMARKILEQLRLPMADAKQQENQSDWLNKIDKLKDTSTIASQTTVAVVGQTGAGKSSLINALLDEEELLPTNGMRACTAVATEIIWNSVDDPQQAYRAEIQFHSKQDWDRELANLFEDVVQDSHEDDQSQPSWGDPDSDAGIAYAKIRAVYPELTHNLLLNTRPDRLAQDPRVCRVLGTTKKIAFSTAIELAEQLAKYLDSVDKDTNTKSKDSTGGFALWPLIKVARIYCKSSILSGGIVIVDLPGTVDMNAARNAVAVDYLSQSDAVFIVAPIKRAVDDASAKELMGKAFKLQLLMDGNYSNVTFICTACDDIDIKESIKSLDKDGHIRRAVAKHRQLKNSMGEKQMDVDSLAQRIETLVARCGILKRELKEWKKHNRNIAKGRPVFVSRVPCKRKQLAKDTIEDNSSESDSDDDEQVTAEEITAKLELLEEQLQVSTAERIGAQSQYAIAKAEFVDLENELNHPDLNTTRLCILKRNSETKKAIQTDFANGVREIDEGGKSDGDVNFVLSKNRDYSLVAQSLPVFTLSSRAFQQLQRRVDQCQAPVSGFFSSEDTELPKLQRYTKQLTREDQIQKHKAYLNDFLTLLASIVVVTSACSQLDAFGKPATELTQEQKHKEEEHLRIRINDVTQQVSAIIFASKSNMQTTSRKALMWKNSQAVTAGRDKSPRVVRRWTDKEEDGGFGLRFSTFRATCRREGAKTRHPKSRDFNDDLLEPFITQLSTTWEEVFVFKLPKILSDVVGKFRVQLDNFHTEMTSRPALKQSRVATLRFLGKHLAEHEQTFCQTIDNAKNIVQEAQRHSSRSWYKHMQKAMRKVYRQCSDQRGRGCFKRMRNIMEAAVEGEAGSKIFMAMGKCTMEGIEEVFKRVESDLVESAKGIIRATIHDDYRRIITAGASMEASQLALGCCHKVLGGVDDEFKAILDGDAEMVLVSADRSSRLANFAGVAGAVEV